MNVSCKTSSVHVLGFFKGAALGAILLSTTSCVFQEAPLPGARNEGAACCYVYYEYPPYDYSGPYGVDTLSFRGERGHESGEHMHEGGGMRGGGGHGGGDGHGGDHR